MYKLIAMIPARLGSRRIPKKNIRYMLDKPLIRYPIDLALNSDKFESIWINTESEKLGNACEKFGVSFHQRPPELSDDNATNRDFVYEFLKKHECDYIVMLNPTSPALRQETVNGFIEYVLKNDFDTVMSVVSNRTEAIYKGRKINFDGSDKIPNEKLEPVEEIVWAMTAWKRDTFLALQEKGECPVFGGKLGTYGIPKDEAADLDNEEDWRVAEGILLAREKEENNRRYMDI